MKLASGSYIFKDHGVYILVRDGVVVGTVKSRKEAVDWFKNLERG